MLQPPARPVARHRHVAGHAQPEPPRKGAVPVRPDGRELWAVAHDTGYVPDVCNDGAGREPGGDALDAVLHTMTWVLIPVEGVNA